MLKTRTFPESNYRAIWYNGKTIRIALDPKNSITELKYPEFYDVKITGKCRGNCPWCYMDSKPEDEHYANVVEKIKEKFGPMDSNERPFQVAIGGGEPTESPEFFDVLKIFYELGIQPNYTTNGMWVTREDTFKGDMIENTISYCGGVAVSCHPHLKKYWEEAAEWYSNSDIKLNFHIIISDKESIDDFVNIYEQWKDKVDYFVLLPYGTQGRAQEKAIDWDYLVERIPKEQKQIAFGANFYPYLKRGGHNIKVSLYEPEIMSKFIDMSDMKVYPSSFNLIEI